MPSLFGNIFRPKFWTSSVQRSRQCPSPSFTPSSDHPDGGYKLYKALSTLIGIPIVLGFTVMLYLKRRQCKEEEREPFAKYEYMRIRSKRFPWGDGNHSFFHNPKVNALPDGYEDETKENCEESE